MTDKTLRRFKAKIKALSLSPFADGRFEVFVNGTKIWSKLETGEFPDEDKLLESIGKA